MNFDVSQFHFETLAKVALTPEINAWDIEVMPTEKTNQAGTEVVAINQKESIQHKTYGGEDNVTVDTSNCIKATWLPWNTTRKTPPNVRRNDDVLIFRLGNSSKYYWVDNSTKNVKRLETILFAISGDSKNPMASDYSNAYFLEVSSHGKRISLHTSQANGEPFGYDIQLDTDDGKLTVIDTALNQIFLDSAETTIGAKNANGTRILLEKKNINAYAPDSIRYEAVNTIAFKCTDFKIDASNSFTLNASNSITLSTKTFKSTANSNLFDCPSSTFTGNVSAANISVGGGASRSGGGGNCTVAGKMAAKSVECDEFNAKKGHISSFTHDGPKCC